MSLFSNAFEYLDLSNKEIWGEYTEDEKNKINDLNTQIGVDGALGNTVFRDKTFFENFLKYVTDDEEQFKYAENTYKYFINANSYDPNYVIFTRRSVPSKNPKPKAFWSSDHGIVLNGLKNELPVGSVDRLYSVIMVTSLAKLINHGIASHEGGKSDGEICIDPEKPFSDFLFLYKPNYELLQLAEYQKQGGKTLEEFLEELSFSAQNRKSAQGFHN